jgi:hypothetical protein
MSQSRQKSLNGPTPPFPSIERLLAFFGGKMLSAIDRELCRAFTKNRSTEAAARRDLEELRAAINYHRQEGRCDRIVSIVLPDKPGARQHWLTRSQVARLLWDAWRFREIQKGKPTDRRSRRHVARFILVAVYTGMERSQYRSFRS